MHLQKSIAYRQHQLDEFSDDLEHDRLRLTATQWVEFMKRVHTVEQDGFSLAYREAWHLDLVGKCGFVVVLVNLLILSKMNRSNKPAARPG